MMRGAQKIFHYPWRFALSPDKFCNLPEPVQSNVSPEIGSFYLSAFSNSPEELPSPSIEVGRWRDECIASDGTQFKYDECVHQYSLVTVDSEVRRRHFALSDAGISLSDILYSEREALAQFYFEMTLGEACHKFYDYLTGVEDRDFASASLIYKIAVDTISAIESIVSAPRKILSRVHREVSIERMQEFDTTTLLDYARRPGRNAPMKAGAKQCLLGVVREESADTTENRVVLDFIWRAEFAALQYVVEMRARCPEHVNCFKKECDGCKSNRLKIVLHFIRKCEAWKQSENFKEVRRLHKPFTRANYVLQQNARYAKVWKYYLKLLSQENVEGDIWRWQRRSFADVMRMVMMCLWELRLRYDRRVVLQTSKRPFMVREENNKGEWLASDPFEDALVYKSEHDGRFVTLYLLNQEETVSVLHCDAIRNFNADFYWVVLQDGQMPKVCPVWCICKDKHWDDSNVNVAYGTKVVEEIRALCHDFMDKTMRNVDVSNGWVIAPAGNENNEGKFADDGFSFFSVDVFRKIDRVFDVLQQGMERMLGL